MKDLIKLIKESRLIFVCGNGGSAATAEHFTADLIKKGYPAICLNSNVSVMTMIANDYGYQYTFAKQLEALGKFSDALITISCSGTSSNIVYAQNLADKLGLQIYPFEVFSKDKDYGKLEDKHLQLIHKVVKKL